MEQVVQHKLRNLFTIIGSNLELADRTTADDSLRRRITVMQEAVKCAVDILDALDREEPARN